MIVLAVVVWLAAANTPTADPTTQIGVVVALFTATAAIIGAVVKLTQASRRREKGEDSLAEQQQTILLEPMRQELARARQERDDAIEARRRADISRDKAWADRAVLILLCHEKNVTIPPEVRE